MAYHRTMRKHKKTRTSVGGRRSRSHSRRRMTRHVKKTKRLGRSGKVGGVNWSHWDPHVGILPPGVA